MCHSLSGHPEVAGCSLLYKLCKGYPVKDTDIILKRAITEIRILTAQGKVLSHQCGEYSLHMLCNSIMKVLEALELMGAVRQLFISDYTAKFLFLGFSTSRSDRKFQGKCLKLGKHTITAFYNNRKYEALLSHPMTKAALSNLYTLISQNELCFKKTIQVQKKKKNNPKLIVNKAPKLIVNKHHHYGARATFILYKWVMYSLHTVT